MSASPLVDHLTRQLETCLVIVSGRIEGSGFFIAPDTVATCAHVAGEVGRQITVTWQDLILPGVVRWASPLVGRGIEPYPDAAVVEVTSPGGGHPVVWLDDHLPRTEAKLIVVGYARTYAQAVGRSSGWFTHGGEYDDMIRLTQDEIEPGMSGAPVLNAETGGICGITKAARRPGQPAGGVAIPVRALRKIMEPEPYRLLHRRHDEHHRRNQRWIRLADELRTLPGTVSGRAERQLRLILAELPAVEHEEHLADYQAIAGDLAQPVRHPLHDYGDVVTELDGLVPADDRFPHVLAYAIYRCRSAQPAVAGRLETWARMAAPPGDEEKVEARLAARRAGEPTPGAGSRLPSVLVYVRPSGPDRKRYRCEIWRHDGTDLTPIEIEGPDHTVAHLREHLRDRLPGLARRGPAGDRHPMIEMVLPLELLDEDVEHWPAAGRRVWPVLGQTNPVVVRELERFEEDDEELLHDWRDRWDVLRDGRIGAALMAVRCGERRAESALYSQFRLGPGLGAVVLPDTPQKASPLRVVLDVGLYAGIPIMIWRRNGCAGGADVAHHECAGAQLAEAVTAALAESGRDDVPARIMQVRNWAAAEGRPECGNDIVLLWDDPGRRLPQPPMEAPTGEHDAGG